MMKKLLKNLALTLVIAATCTISAQENYDFTSLECAGDPPQTKFSGSQAALTCDATGFIFTPVGTKNFFEVRINAVTTSGQDRVTINYTNNTTADGVFFKASSTVLEGGAVVTLGATSVEYVFTDTNFTAAPGNIQLRTRFTSSAGVMPNTATMVLTSLVVDNAPTAGIDDVFSKANTRIISEEGKIIVKNAPEGTSIKIYNIIGQSVANNNLASGTYVVKLSAQGATSSKKIMIL